MHAGKLGLQPLGAQWSFVVGLYEQPGVSEACLLLQDRLGADVCLLLFVLYVACEHRAGLEMVDLDGLDDAIAAWRREVVWPLRSLRRRMLSGPDPAPDPATEGLLQQIKTAEIHAEQIELAALAWWFDRRPQASSATAVDIAVVLDRLVAFFAARGGNPGAGTTAEVRAALHTIAEALSRPSRRMPLRAGDSGQPQG